MRKDSEYNAEGISNLIGAQRRRLINKRDKRSSVYHKFQNDFESTDKIHGKYNRSERRNFIQVANKLYCRPIVH